LFTANIKVDDTAKKLIAGKPNPATPNSVTGMQPGRGGAKCSAGFGVSTNISTFSPEA